MSRKQEPMTFSGALEVQAQKPLDGRRRVALISDLTEAASYPYIFKGLDVFCEEDENWYTFLGGDSTDINNWRMEGSGGGGGTVDAAMSDTSTNAVQNKAIKKYIDDKAKVFKAIRETTTTSEIIDAVNEGKSIYVYWTEADDSPMLATSVEIDSPYRVYLTCFCYTATGEPLFIEHNVNTDVETTWTYTTAKLAGGLDGVELTQAQYDALSDAEKHNGAVYFVTDGQGGGGGGGGDQWTVLDKNTVITANELQALENSKKPIMWFDGFYYTPIMSMDTNVEWGSGYIDYEYNGSRYYIPISYDGDDWDQPVTWGTPYVNQVAAKLEIVNGNGGIRVGQVISGRSASMWLYPDWNITNFVNSQLVLSNSTKRNDLMTRYSQPQNIVKTGRVQVDVGDINKSDTVNVDISELNFEQSNDYMVIATLESSDDVAYNIQHNVSSKAYSGFNINARNGSGAPISGSTYVNYMVLANRYFELYSTSTAITNSTASGGKYTWAQITTDKSAYNDFSVLKNVPNGRLRVYPPNSTTPALAQYDTEGTETQDTEHWYYPIKWANPDGTSTLFDNFKYLARSKKGGADNDLWLASAPSTDGLDAYQCPAIDKITIVREK